MDPGIHVLDDSQLESFDTEYVVGNRWDTVRKCIDRDFPAGRFRFLDVGGGNGKFADRLLETYPQAQGTVLDNSELLLSKNIENSRKTVILASVDDLGNLAETYDLICVHWLLHHLVGGRYQVSRQHQLTALCRLGNVLSADGRLCVFENIYTGWWVESMPGWLIFQLTSIKFIAALTKRLGANTAGVGVCFLSKSQWFKTIKDASLQVQDYSEPDDWIWPLRIYWKILLHLRSVRVGHFWIRSAGSSRVS